MDKNIIQGHWREIKGEILRAWGELTDNELDRFKGNLASLAGQMQAKYGYAKEEVESKLSEIIDRFRNQGPRDEPDVTAPH